MADVRIQKPQAKPNLQRVRFSFEHLQADHTRFPLAGCSKEYLEALVRRMLVYQTWPVDEFLTPDPSAHRHPIYFKNTSEKDGFTGIDPSLEDLWTDDAWQIALSESKVTPECLWRVYGFMAGNIFHVVWLDPLHILD